MNRFGIVTFFLIVVGSAAIGSTEQGKPADLPNKGDTRTIVGVVRDLYCPMQNLGATAHDFDVECAVMCLRAGSPLIIQSVEGQFYFPISDTLPDTDQRPRLLPFAGKRVTVTGLVRVRDGVNAIYVTAIKEAGDKDKGAR
jgi:hypothetical protein